MRRRARRWLAATMLAGSVAAVLPAATASAVVTATFDCNEPSYTPDAGGSVTFTWIVRADEVAGAHTVVLTGTDSGSDTGSFRVVIPAGEPEQPQLLPATC